MFDVLFTEPVLTCIVISLFLAPGISVLFLHWKKTVLMPGFKPRRWFAKIAGSVLVLCGIVIFLLSIVFVLKYHRNALYGWLFVVVVGTLLMTTIYTFFSYRFAFRTFTVLGGKIEPTQPYSKTNANKQIRVKKNK